MGLQMVSWFNLPRAVLAYLMAIVAALALTLFVVQSWMAHAIFDEDRFASTAVEISERRDVQRELRRVLVDQVIEAQPDLVGVRPLLETVVDAVLASGIARPVITEGARELHRVLFRSDRPDIVLALPDLMTLVAAGVRTYDADVAERIPGGPSVEVVELTQRNAATRIIEIDQQLEALRWLFIAVAVVAIGAALVLAPSRQAALAVAGISMVGGAIVCWLAVGIVADLIHASVSGNPVAADAATAAWGTYAEGLIWWMWLQAIAGVLLATVATSAGAPRPARLRIQQATSLAGAAWENRGSRIVLAIALMTVGLLLLVSPLVTVRVMAQAAGLALLYLGGVEAVQALGISRVRRRRDRQREPGRPLSERLLEAGATLGLLGGLVAIGAVFWFNRGSFSVEEADVQPPIEDCNGAADLCDRPLNEIAWAATHNSMAASDEPGWFLANQTHGINQQLRDGIRVLLIDLYYGYATNRGVRTDLAVEGIPGRVEGGLGPEAAVAVENLINLIGPIPDGAEPSLYLCHGQCELGSTPFEAMLGNLRDFLTTNPNEVVILVLQDYVDPFDVEDAFIRTGLAELVHMLDADADLPTLRDLIELDQRVIVFSENLGTQDAPPWYHDAFAFTQDTPFLFRSPEALNCEPNRGSADAPFFLLNHWLSVRLPKPADATVLNEHDFLLERVRQCEAERELPVNFIAVNFYEVGDLFGVVEELNERDD